VVLGDVCIGRNMRNAHDGLFLPKFIIYSLACGQDFGRFTYHFCRVNSISLTRGDSAIILDTLFWNISSMWSCVLAAHPRTPSADQIRGL